MKAQAQGNQDRRYYGKYRGKVLENIDPMELGRIMVEVPALVGLEASWALPCVPYAGPQVGFVMIPPIGANVWVEFEGGDPTHPIWAGCFWGELEKPVLNETPYQKVIKTESFTLFINDVPGAGEMMIEMGPPAFEIPVILTMDAAGLQIETAEAIVSMSPEEITATLPPTVVTITEESVDVVTEGVVTVTAEDVNVTANVDVTGPVEVTGNVELTGAVEIEGNVEITGAVEIEGNVEIAGAVEVEGNVEIAGAVEIEGNVDVTGAVEVVGDTAVIGAFEVVGDQAVAGAVEVAGPLVAATLTGVPIP
ncbi:phage baseplate assembly protein V [Archangium lansingense]|uniref:Phage baseplate assembly protein V n=1 Tax=Archangium lansingense TaxID=2995310 RepID=A0ABT4ANB2_9BACT|nr:phage baseplate assembly protein V [Archangium lansinium]MCY1083066.1 phage baseplate assembly protein V [Archangium lansinium]